LIYLLKIWKYREGRSSYHTEGAMAIPKHLDEAVSRLKEFLRCERFSGQWPEDEDDDDEEEEEKTDEEEQEEPEDEDE
jgi:hypothetical protein